MVTLPKVTTLLSPFGVLILGGAFCGLMLYFWRGGREFRTNGVTAQAVVMKKFRKGGGLENFYATVSFTDRNRQSRIVELKIASRAWRGLREGETTAVTYLAGQPDRVEQGPKWGKDLIGFVFLFMATIAAVGSVTAFVLTIRSILSEMAAGGS